MKRRTLLKLLGAAAVSPAALPEKAGARPIDAGMRRQSLVGIEPAEEIPSICDLCLWRCGILVKVRDGRIVRVQGNPDHPRSRGRLCARGNSGRCQVEDPDRLKFPLMRVGERGEGKWKRISWDQALDLWAQKTRETIENYGPGSIGTFSHGLSSRFINSFMLHIGNPNRAVPSFGQCRGPRDVGFQLTFGEGPGSPERHDMARSRMVVLIGSHIGENVQTGQVAEFAEAVDRGARIVVVDPRMSVAASKAHRWLPIRPGTDTALLLAWIHVLLKEDLYDHEYIKQYAIGIEELRRAVAGNNPKCAAEVTQIPEEVIVEEARHMARLKPAVMIHCGRFSTWYGNDTQRNRAMAILVALLGAWGRPGGYYLRSSVELGPRPCPPPHGDMDQSVATGRHAFTHFGVTSQEIVEASIGPKSRIKQWILYAVNPIQSLPDIKRTRKALRSVDFITMVDILPTEGALWADLILPEAVYLERYDDVLAVLDHPRPFLALRQPAVPPAYEAKGPYWIAQQLAHRLDHKDCFAHPDVTDYLDARLAPQGITCAELARKGIHQLEEQRPYLKPGDPGCFTTPSGKIELFSATLSRMGYDPIPAFEPVEQPPRGWFRLVSGRNPYHSFARTQNLKRLTDKAPENALWLNESVARAKGLSSGDRVYLQNREGFRTGPIKVLATPAIRTDLVYTVHGYGSRSHVLGYAYARGVSDNILTTRFRADPATGGTGIRVNFVQLVTRDGKEIPGEADESEVQRSIIAPPAPKGRPPPCQPAEEKPRKKGGKDVFKVKLEDSC
jgi:thiosulfate reductase/polysulfide reductase chain A